MASAAALDAPPIVLRQRGRASTDFLVRIGRALDPVRREVRARADAALDEAERAAPFAEREAALTAKLAGSNELAAYRLLFDWMSDAHGEDAKRAFDELQGDLAGWLDAPGAPERDPQVAEPDYYHGVAFHRTQGGWTGHPEMGFVHSELIFRRIIAASRPIDPIAQRRLAAQAAPRRDYRRIFEMGASSGWFTQALAETFPEAEIAGCDLAPEMLREAYRIARRLGRSWRLYHADAAHTREPDASQDLVASYIVFHELPQAAARDLLAETWRILAPGGDVLIADFAPLGQNDPLDELILHYGTRDEGGEPWVHEYLALDMPALLAELGFVDISARGIGPKSHPWVVTARKPA
jgi:SAM-dependent methyltransferase